MILKNLLKGRIRDIIRVIQNEGWYEIKSGHGGSHRHYKHPTITGKLTVSGKLSDRCPRELANTILKMAGVK